MLIICFLTPIPFAGDLPLPKQHLPTSIRYPGWPTSNHLSNLSLTITPSSPAARLEQTPLHQEPLGSFLAQLYNYV